MNEIHEVGGVLCVSNLYIHEYEDVNTCGIIIPISFLDIIDISSDSGEDNEFMSETWHASLMVSISFNLRCVRF